MLILLICNGGDNQLISGLGDFDENIQQRLMLLVSDYQFSERLIDFQMLQEITDLIIAELIEDLKDDSQKYSSPSHNLVKPVQQKEASEFATQIINQLLVLSDLLQL